MAIYRGIGGAGDSTTDATVTAVTQQATNAAASATSAASSASAASSSASAAATSASNAATSASAASTDADDAAASAAAALASETAAATSESNAADSETAAAASETNAATNEANAATSETNAATSETNAATSEANAATSETNAASSASAAATSATNASNSASAASAAQTAAEAAQAAAEAAQQAIDGSYLGAQTSDPTLDLNGDPVTAGDWYYNTNTDVTRIYDGSVWNNGAVSTAGFLLAGNNLSDVTDAATARTNLGLGTAATTASTDYATAAQGATADTAVQPNTTPTFSGVNFGDNAVANFGNSNDLRLYHSGIHSYIDDAGTGNLYIRANNLSLGKYTGETYLFATSDDAVTLYHNNLAKFYTSVSGVTVSGDIAVTGTVDGRDVATDGTKLDGIEAGATGDQTASEILTAIKTVDGAGSGLDADTLDGQHASAFLTAETDPVVGAVSGIVKANGAGTISAAVADTDYLSPSGIFNVNSGAPSSSVNVDVNGKFLVGTTDTSLYNNTSGAGFLAHPYGAVEAARDSGGVLYLNRMGTDGAVLYFQGQGVTEGFVSISGTTVSYNGGHLARFSQFGNGVKDETILKGTVLSNLDEMNVYVDADGNTVDNEQLNKVKVSDVEGDVNVAGVFVNWDFDEAHNVDEINMAMTGDMIIRIAQGTTVQRGDLLMSAGDGTAKPQGDDIIRSKTIAKVTSTNVTYTYADGSYCVPCVLMAC